MFPMRSVPRRNAAPLVRRLVIIAVVALVAAGLAAWRVLSPSSPAAPASVGSGSNTATVRVYDVPPAMATQFAAQAATRLLNWRVVRTDVNAGVLQVEVPVLGGLTKNPLTVAVTPTGENGRNARVAVSSENPADIRALQTAMDENCLLPPRNRILCRL